MGEALLSGSGLPDDGSITAGSFFALRMATHQKAKDAPKQEPPVVFRSGLNSEKPLYVSDHNSAVEIFH